MNMTVQDILIDALGLIHVIAIDETPETSELNNALRAANVMLDSWSAHGLMLRSNTTLVIPLTGSKSSYTVGLSGCDVTTSKIMEVSSGYVTDSNTDHPLEVWTKEQYDTLEDKNVSTSRPIYVAYDPGSAQQSSQKGTLYFYYTPDKSYNATLEVQQYLTEFVNLSDNVTFEPAYYEAIIYNLAVRLFRRYHKAEIQVPQDLAVLANSSKNTVMNMNHRITYAALDLPAKVNKYNIYTDGQ